MSRPKLREFRAGTLSLVVRQEDGELWADVFADGRDESICTVRLAEDEVFFYDAREDEGELIYPDDSAALCVRCRKGPARPGFSTCATCQEREASRR